MSLKVPLLADLWKFFLDANHLSLWNTPNSHLRQWLTIHLKPFPSMMSGVEYLPTLPRWGILKRMVKFRTLIESNNFIRPQYSSNSDLNILGYWTTECSIGLLNYSWYSNLGDAIFIDLWNWSSSPYEGCHSKSMLTQLYSRSQWPGKMSWLRSSWSKIGVVIHLNRRLQ